MTKSLAVALVLTLATPHLAFAQNSLDMTIAASTRSSSAQSSQSSQATSIGTLIVLGAGLLAGVGGGITTTMYRKRDATRPLQQPVVPPAPELQPIDPNAPAPLPPPEGPPPPPPPSVLRFLTPGGEPTVDAMVLARAWLLANELQLKQDLALGMGPAIDDLAGMAGIAPARKAHFGRVMQKHRAQFLSLQQLTPEQAARMMSRVGDLVLADPLLRSDGEAVLAAW